jgi:ribulose-phosphate 3-epimerase
VSGRPVKIGASILAADFLNIESEVKRAEQAKVDSIHIDVMDGHLVSDIAFGAGNVRSVCGATDICVDAHLMIARPQSFAMRMIEAGAGIITLQMEPCLDLYKTISDIKAANARAYVCIRPETSAGQLEEVLEWVDGVLLVSVPLGIGGQKMIPSMKRKISRLAEYKNKCGYSFEIGVDGGVTTENAAEITACGADYLVCGTTLFASTDMRATVESLKRRM